MAGFRHAEHIRKRADFERVYQTGSKFPGRLMIVFTLGRDAGPARLGIAATRKMGAAVERNRAKRLVRELFRHNKPAVSIDVVVVPRREMLNAPYGRLEDEFRSLLGRHRSRAPTPQPVDGRATGAGPGPSL